MRVCLCSVPCCDDVTTGLLLYRFEYYGAAFITFWVGAVSCFVIKTGVSVWALVQMLHVVSIIFCVLLYSDRFQWS